MTDKLPRSIEEQIRKAIQDGSFDDLPGKGKPLDLDINPHEEPDMGMAHHMLRSSGYTLPWIETRRMIEAELDEARSALERSLKWRCAKQDQDLDFTVVDLEWRRAVAVFEEKIKDLNKRIFNYNLQIPANQFFRYKIDLEREIAQITGQSD